MFFKIKEPSIKVLPFIGVFFCCSYGYSLNANENSASGFIGLCQPAYGKFSEFVRNNGSPAFSDRILALGGVVTFINRNVLFGGKIVTANTGASIPTIGSYFSNTYMGFNAGYAIELGPIDMSLSHLLGLGKIVFANASSGSGSVIEADYLVIEPQFYMGFILSNNFKLGVNAGYYYGIPYQMRQYGVELLTGFKDIKVQGMQAGVSFSFGDFR